MSILHAVAKNTAIQFAGKVATTILGLVTVALIQRALQPTGYGAFVIVLSYVGFFSVLADLGLYLILIREFNQPNADKNRIYANVLGIRLVSCGIIFALSIAVIPFFGYGALVNQGVLIAILSYLAVAVTQLTVSVFQSSLTMSRVVFGELIGRAVLLIWVALALFAGGGLLMMVLGVAISSVINMIFLLTQVRKQVRVRIAFEKAYWGYLLRQTAPVAISVTLNLLYFRLDTIILSLYRSSAEVGLYGAAYKILETLNTFPIMFVGLLLPILTQAFVADRTRFQQVYQQSFDVLVLAVLPLIVGGWFLAEPLIRLVSGEAYIAAAPVLRLLLIAVGWLFLNSLSGHTVTIINQQKKMVWGYLTVAGVGLAVYLLIIPQLGMRGAAIGTIITEALSAVIGAWVVFRTMKFRLRFGNAARVVLASAIMALALWLLPSENLWLGLIVGIGVYAGAVLAVRAVPRNLFAVLMRRSI